MAVDSPRVFSIPSGTPFLDALAQALLQDPTLGGHLLAGAKLKDFTILVPTRRAARALADAFLRAGGGTALLLSAIHPLGDIDEDELILDPRGLEAAAFDLPPAISSLERQIRLSRFILAQWQALGSPQAGDAPRALALAADLGRFLDMAITERVDLENLHTLVPDEFAANWQITIEFLKVLTGHWPTLLAEQGVMDEVARRNKLLAAQAEAWAVKPPAGPVIAAGSTGSIPATADLLNVIARLPQGAVILPGLDFDLDALSWDELANPTGASHPQYGLAQLLIRLRLTREDVLNWPGVTRTPTQEARAELLSEALRPASTTSRWRLRLSDLATKSDEALAGLSLVEAPTQRIEASAIALMMREVLDTPGKTAALITPDRGLARRVVVELRRWRIEVDDSGGVPLAATPPLVFLSLVAQALAEDLAPLPLLACLKHPLAALGEAPARLRLQIRQLERALLRGPRPAPGIEGLRRALLEAKEEREADGRIARDLDALTPFLSHLEAAIAPLRRLFATRSADLETLLAAHLACAEDIACTDTEPGGKRLWAGGAGDAVNQFVKELMQASSLMGIIETRNYPRLLAELARGRALRPRFGRHPRLFIWGPLEARLQHADRMILGSLNEGTWPAEANVDPWLNRPMRGSLGIEPPERRIGLAAHDFVEGASAAEAVLTRSRKIDGAPTVASRWLLRLTSLLKGFSREEAIYAPQWTHWAEILDAPPAEATPCAPPAPRPPRAARPARFSVTEVETLIRDPYAIYAKKVLNLTPLDDIDANVAAAERGTIIHRALEEFVIRYPDALPENASNELLRIGRDTFAHIMDRPGVAAFWWPRFERIAQWIVDRELALRRNLRHAHAELRGEIAINGLGRPLILSAKADRIDKLKDGTLAIIDYKTGQMPSVKEVKSGLAPQLPLEAAIATRGGFAGLDAAMVSSLAYLRLNGGEKAGEERLILDDVAALAEKLYAEFVDLLKQYENEETPYLSRPRPKFEGRYGDYDHLARTREWTSGNDRE